jgi:RNA polymerase sigma-54 factor
MRLDLNLQQRLSQQLVITVQLQQAIKLLQLNHLELVAQVQNEMLENPTLEEVPGTASNTVTDQEQALQDGATKQQEDVVEQNNGSENQESIDWQKVLEEYSSQNKAPSSGPSKFDELPPIENSLSTSESLADHLLWQLGMQAVTEDEYRAALAIIHNLDERGWLDSPLETIAEESGLDLETVSDAHGLILAFDPIGCGARDLKECLTVQAKVTWPEDPNFVRILQDHLGEIETRNYQAIATKLGIEVEDVVEYHKMIQKLEPWPGRPFADAPPQYITPDITVVQVGGEWQILQNDDGLPRLRVSPYYKRILENGLSKKEERDYVKERLESADFLIKSIYKRQRTIHKVMACILERQRDFFDKGPETLKPMILKDVADEIGVHESTVSRVTTNKYVQCPHGIFELKYFFNAGIQRLGGEDLAAEAVKQKIRKLVGEENRKSPMSDQQIVQVLASENIKIARRTVAKYREALGILPSQQRKHLF